MGFYQKIPAQVGFHPGWVNKVMLCVETVRYMLRLNGKSSGVIKSGSPLNYRLYNRKTGLKA